MHLCWKLLSATLFCVACIGNSYAHNNELATTVEVGAATETLSNEKAGTKGFDATTWVNPADPRQSIIFSSDSSYGLISYELSGQQRQALPMGKLRHIDLRQRVPISGGHVTVLAAANVSLNSLDILFVNAKGTAGIAKRIDLSLQEPTGVCLLLLGDELHAFVSDINGTMQQWHINANSLLKPTIVGQHKFGHRLGGCEVDDREQTMFVSAPEHGIWLMPADIKSARTKVLLPVMPVESGQDTGPTDVSLMHTDLERYLLIGHGQSEDIWVTQLDNHSRSLTGISIIKNKAADSVQGSLRVHANSSNLGTGLERGLVIVSDRKNKGAGGKANFKLVPGSVLLEQLPVTLAQD